MKARLGVLDGLRAIAVLLVLWYHTWLMGHLDMPVWWLQLIPATGLYGVHLFFFLSGFVIVYPFAHAQFSGLPQPTWGHFAWRRFIKIVPSYVLSIAAAYAIGLAAYERMTLHTTIAQELITHALFIHTWWPRTDVSINAVLWTLAIEAEFYAIFPALWWCFKRWPWVTGLALIGVAWNLRAWGHFIPNAALLAANLPGYVDLFACGMLCAWTFVHLGHRAREGSVRRLMPLVAIAGIALVIVILGRQFTGLGAVRWSGIPIVQARLALGVGFGLLAFGALCSPPRFERILANRPLQFIAIVSYNLYLYNWMILHKLQWLHILPYHGSPDTDVHWKIAFTIVGFAISILFAAIVTYLIERPLLRLSPPPAFLTPRHRASVAPSGAVSQRPSKSTSGSTETSTSRVDIHIFARVPVGVALTQASSDSFWRSNVKRGAGFPVGIQKCESASSHKNAPARYPVQYM